MANLPTATAEPGLLDLTNTPTLPWWKDQGLRKLIFWQTCILAAQITVGYDEVIVGSFQALQPWQDGGFFGALLAAAPADRYGRRFALQIGSFLGVVGSVMQAASPNRNVFVGGRAVLGVGLSFTTTAGPNLLTELAHPRLRGKMASINWSWRIPSIVQTAFPFLLMIATIFIPESPRWLCSRGRQIEAKDFLIKYHANGNESDPVIDLEMHEIATALNPEEQSKMYTWSNLLKSKANRRRLGICLSVSVLTLCNGQGVISYYFSPILDSVGITNTTQQTGINGGLAIWNLICSVTGAFLADKIGRRKLWLISFIGMIFANVPLTITSAMYANHGSQAAAYGTVVFLFLYNAAFNIACNPLLYCYTPEILPYSIRSKGLALQVLSSQVMLTVNQYVNPIALERIGYYYFIFYLGMLLLGLALIYFTFPETKGYSLEELVITGGGHGFGEAIARRFALEGAKVLISDINEADGQRVASDAPDAISFCKANVTDAGEWEKLLDTAQERYGRIDILVNNAGTTYKNKPTAEVTEAEFDRVFNVNVKGILLGTNALMPRLIKQGSGGVMLNISSIGSVRPRPGLVWYNASKGAVSNATKGLAAEYGPHQIRVNSICPLLSGTGLFEHFAGMPDTPENRKNFIGNVPLGRLCESEDVANTCLFLASDEGKFITGINMEVDGGRAV
ncbi:hypothetical protein CBS470a_007201 [Colletotrichum nupharicola]|nr:hypothetical protein CBS470a_007201 [Colletotrichum nupharicola]